MLEINETRDGGKLKVDLVGRLDAKSSTEFENQLAEEVGDVTELILDMAEVDFVSSAGLRALLYIQNIMDEKGATMVLQNVDDDIKEVFLVTGFLDILTIR
jgi:anti-sigma B factor antagonist